MKKISLLILLTLITYSQFLIAANPTVEIQTNHATIEESQCTSIHPGQILTQYISDVDCLNSNSELLHCN